MEFDAKQGFRLGDRAIYPALNRVVSGDTEHTVEGKVMDVLVALARNPDDVVSKNELLDAVWPNQDVADGVLVRAIHQLRQVLDDSAQNPRYIENVPRVGYRLVRPPAPIEPARTANPLAERGYAVAAIATAVAVIAVAWHFVGPEPADPSINSVVVLPFVNMTGNPEKDDITDGITEEVIHLMAQQPRLHVSARTSSFAMRGTELSVADIGKRLNVDTIVEGSIRQERGTQRITVQLIHAATGAHQGSITVDVREDDLFGAQELLGGAIVSMLSEARQADQLGARLAPRFLALHAFREGDLDTFEREIARSYESLNIEPAAARMIADAARDSSLLGDLVSRLEPFGTPRNNYFARELAQPGLHEEALDAFLRYPKSEGTFISDVWLPEFRPMRALRGFVDLALDLGLDAYWRQYGLPDACKGHTPEAFCRHFTDLAS
jgi:TolB-like protein